MLDSGRVVLEGADREVLLSTVMNDGQFVLKGTIAEPGRYTLRIGDRPLSVVLDGKDMEFFLNYDESNAIFWRGAPAQSMSVVFQQWMKKHCDEQMDRRLYEMSVATADLDDPKEIDSQMREAMMEMAGMRKRAMRTFVERYSDELYTPVAIRDEIGTNYEMGQALYDLLTERAKNTQPGRLLKGYLGNISQTVIGKPLPSFLAENEQGESMEVKLEKGRVYVVDFWASWCGPCRAEMVELRKFYQELEKQPVEFISVSLDKSKSDWLKACEEEQIPWISLWVENAFDSRISKLLGIGWIPFIVVVDQAGKIAAKDVRGEALIESVKKLL